MYNTDGASRGNPGISSYVFCLRNADEDIIYAKAALMEDTTNSVAEATIVLQASKHCQQVGYNQVIFQTDSMVIQKVLLGEWGCPWSIAWLIDEIQANLQGKEVIIQHILREENKLIDYQDNHEIHSGNCKYESFRSMKVQGRGIINSDWPVKFNRFMGQSGFGLS
ncbi:uncharacterized protein LOC107874153 [Capsicum annuum]|uniref:uncharacterized protein LOC107874153 n=1 Tax=Capsicum annuum TaxID=4072 RepID=UPI0007BFE8A3|nr:uncharacterized protein LOC107874153 [Capsicum annuum]